MGISSSSCKNQLEGEIEIKVAHCQCKNQLEGEIAIKVAHCHSTWKMDSSSAKQIFSQKFESNWNVDASSRGIQLKIHLKFKC